MHGSIDLAGAHQGEAARQSAREHIEEHARTQAMSLPLADFDPGHPELFRTDSHWPYFDRLRRDEPVHHCKESMFGPYWTSRSGSIPASTKRQDAAGSDRGVSE